MSTYTQALDAVKQNGLALKDFPEWNRDYTLVLFAVRQNGMALEFASVYLRDHGDIIGVAVAQNQDAARFALE